METYAEIPSAAAREAVKKLGSWLGELRPLLHIAAAPRSKWPVS
jgi:hypothetical protein